VGHGVRTLVIVFRRPGAIRDGCEDGRLACCVRDPILVCVSQPRLHLLAITMAHHLPRLRLPDLLELDGVRSAVRLHSRAEE